MRILHVEDNRTDVDLVARTMQRTSPDSVIEVAGSLEEARDLLQNPKRFNAILVDLMLPDGSGLELLNEIRERQLPLAVVMLTGSGDQKSAIAALQSGADDYVPKDIEAFARLGSTLNSAIARSKERSSRQSRTLRVLYAEHNAADADLTRRHIERHAPYIRLTIVPDATLALSHLPPDDQHPAPFDVVLLDYRLPGIDALDAVRAIRVERGLTLPIVVVSGQGSEKIAAQAINLGVDGYIAKHPGYLYELAPTLEMVHRQSELVREKQALNETSRHLNYLLEESPVVLYTLRIDAGAATPTWVSANIKRLFGFEVGEVLHRGWWPQHLHPDDLEMSSASFTTLLRDGSVEHDYRLLDRDGNTRWIHDELRLLDTSGDGSPVEALGAWHDVTQKKQTEQIAQTRMAALDGLVAGRNIDSILLLIAEQLEAIRPDMRVSILLRDSKRDILYTVAAPSLPDFFNDAVDGLKPQVGNGSCGTSAALGEPVIVEDVFTHPYWAAYTALTRQAGIRACWSIPFKEGDGSVLGTFGIYYNDVRAPDQNDLQLIDEFARISGLAVQRANADTDLRQAAAVFASTNEGVVITDLQPRIIAVNRAYTEITGYEESEVIGRNPGLLQSGRQDEAFYQAMWASLLEQGHWQGEIWNRRKSGEVYPQLLTLSTVRDNVGKPKNYVGVMTDVSQLKKSEANIEQLAHFDPLTGLPNRLLIHSRLEHAIAHSRRERAQVAVLFIDIDRFKNVNDSLGHPVGDRLLQDIAKRLQSHLRGDDSFGRLGGDEFLVILDQSRRPDDAAKIAQKLIQLLDAPFSLPDAKDIYIGASIGISVFPQDGTTASELIQHADSAMYQAKEHGRNTFRFYTPALTETVNRRLLLESNLRRAIGGEEFVLHYQPQIEVATGKMVGCEALLRWNDPAVGMVSPAEFIPLAEETGLILPLGAWVIEEACTQFRAWREMGLTDFCMAINLSGRQLQDDTLVAQIADAIRRHDLPAERVKLELTESMIMGHGEKTVALLHSMKALGVRLAIDDFGTGYSSLAYLKRFPIDELKIDGSFVRDIPGDSSDSEIAATIIAMANSLKMRVVAEGVETEEQAKFLADNGCQYYQGYLFSRPLPPHEFERLMQSLS